MSTKVLNEEITRQTAVLQDAEARAADVAQRFTKAPDNGKLQTEMIEAYRDVANAKETIRALEQARPVSWKADQEAQEAARKAEVSKALEGIKSQLAQRIALGKAVDDALAQLREAGQAWTALSVETFQAIRLFYRLATPEQKDPHMFPLGDEAVAEIARQVDAATKGLSCASVLETRYSGKAERVADAAQKMEVKVRKYLEYLAG
ncbi:MAG: hypothetical protein KUL86_06990 [Castellaniella sp.]|nr:hypothetical protein [Castellaniella sp.]